MTSETCAMETEKRHSPSTPIDEGPPEEKEPTSIEPRKQSIQSFSKSQDLLSILDAQIRKQEDDNVPGSIGGLLTFETLPPPPPEVGETDSEVGQEADTRSQATLEGLEPAVPGQMDVTYPQYVPLQRTYYWRDDFRNDHLDMHVCTCPQSTIIRPPRWFGFMFGVLTLVFCMSSLPGSLVCCNAMCQRKPKRHIRLDFRLPVWLATTICLSIFCWDNMDGFSRFLQLQKSREIEDPNVAFAIELGDIRWLRRQVAAKRLLPFDTLKGFGEPLAVSYPQVNTSLVGCELTFSLV